ncbi:MAG: NAD-dependent epimerase/dehydratase family protein [Candidatus Omnitrophica bacterium]|nr:NAD-dependent epimerase/dehydratase family protein [Candidatus Omnitrophota bacterium]
MRILITGGAGLVGSHSAEYFSKKGHDVIVFDNLGRSSLFKSERSSVEFNWEFLGQVKGVSRIVGDIRSETDMDRAMSGGIDAVVHAAGQPGVGFSIENPHEDFSINAFGTLNVLEAARKHKAKIFIYCSTNKVYGENVRKIPLAEKGTRYEFANPRGIAEDFPLDLTAHTPYGVSKYAGDLYVQEYGHLFGMRTAVFRMSCIYGTRQFGFEDQGWVAWFLIAALTGQKITIFGDGKQVRDVLYVTDLVRAYESFMLSDLPHAVFNIGGGPSFTLSLLELLDFIREKRQIDPKIAFTRWRPSDQKVYISDISKIRKLLKWAPQVPPQEGLARLADWITSNMDLFVGARHVYPERSRRAVPLR